MAPQSKAGKLVAGPKRRLADNKGEAIREDLNLTLVCKDDQFATVSFSFPGKNPALHGLLVLVL